MTEIAGLPFWEVTFDADGDPDAGKRTAFLTELPARGITDLIVFSHGWNNDRRIALELCDRFFGTLAAQLQHVPAGRTTSVGLAGILWPSQRWSDEPIPNFGAPAPAGAPGAAALADRQPDGEVVADARLDPDTLTTLRQLFPTATGALDRMAELLAGPPTDEAQAEFHQRMREFATLGGAPGDDGEDGRARPDLEPAEPGMLMDGPTELFGRYSDALRRAGVVFADAEPGAGEAGLRDRVRGIWNGAKEALRQLTYWQMKNRAGTVGKNGLGPLIGQLHQAAPDIRVHLVGHSFGARLVSYALAGLPAGLEPSPVKAVTLLQGAFSHWAYARQLQFDASRGGALAGMLDRIDGPLVVCYSSHDRAVGTFYPLASRAARDDSAGADDPASRWGGMGADGARGVEAVLDAIRGAGPGNRYPFAAGKALNIDASEIVRAGGPPSGAHSDIVHPELTWIVLTAGGIASA
jgi:hypothetical protein